MKKVFTLCWALLATPAMATDWLQSAASNSGAVWYVDIDSVQSVSDGYNSMAVKAWVKIDYSKVASEPAREAKLLYFFRCAEEKAKHITRVTYRANGSVIDSFSPSFASYEPVVPESVLSGAMLTACTAYELSKKALS